MTSGVGETENDFEGNGRFALTEIREGFHALDERIYLRLAAPTEPWFDTAISHISNAANHSKISMVMTVVLAAVGGRRGRQAAITGIASVAITSAVANLVIKPVAHRRRPRRSPRHRDSPVDTSHHVKMPDSTSFPSGHSAAAFSFAAGVSQVWPAASIVPFAVAVTVAYSRVHTGVHYPADVLVGSLLGVGVANGVAAALPRLAQRNDLLATIVEA